MLRAEGPLAPANQALGLSGYPRPQTPSRQTHENNNPRGFRAMAFGEIVPNFRSGEPDTATMATETERDLILALG